MLDADIPIYFSRARLRIGAPPLWEPRKSCPEWRQYGKLPEIDQVLADPAASFWLKGPLSSALDRDPVDAANDAEVLAQLLDRRCQEILSRG